MSKMYLVIIAHRAGGGFHLNRGVLFSTLGIFVLLFSSGAWATPTGVNITDASYTTDGTTPLEINFTLTKADFVAQVVEAEIFHSADNTLDGSDTSLEGPTAFASLGCSGDLVTTATCAVDVDVSSLASGFILVQTTTDGAEETPSNAVALTITLPSDTTPPVITGPTFGPVTPTAGQWYTAGS
ncbi:MAG: hypothetical protein AABY11_03495, partial [archaeon]